MSCSCIYESNSVRQIVDNWDGMFYSAYDAISPTHCFLWVARRKWTFIFFGRKKHWSWAKKLFLLFCALLKQEEPKRAENCNLLLRFKCEMDGEKRERKIWNLRARCFEGKHHLWLSVLGNWRNNLLFVLSILLVSACLFSDYPLRELLHKGTNVSATHQHSRQSNFLYVCVQVG